jgi:hypothetical protein
MAKYVKITPPIGAVVSASRQGGDDHWAITHKDGLVTRLSDAKFKKRYEKVSKEKKDQPVVA